MILAPNSRLLLLDALKPPPGYYVDAAIGTTFTLSLDALLIPPAAWAAHAVADRVDDVDPILLANTLRTFAERTLVFHQAGCASPFAVGYESLAPFLDEMVFPVTVSPHSTFHPKVWVLRFRSESGDQGLRVLISSRNLSFDTTWDLIARLDSVAATERGIDAGPLADLLSSLPDRCSITLPDDRRELHDGLVDDLRAARFQIPDGVESAEIVAWRGGQSIADLFPSECAHRLVLSPFLGEDLLSQLPKPAADGRSVLVSRPASLTEERAWGFEAYTLQTDVTDVEDGDEARLGSDLHAKVFAFDDGYTATVVLGSANATSAAFGNNDEVVLRLHGNAADLGVRRLLGEDEVASDDDDRDLELRSLLAPWTPGPDDGTDEDDGRFFDDAVNVVASVRIEGRCTEVEVNRHELTLQFNSSPQMPDGIGVEFTLLGQATPLPPAFSGGTPVTLTLPTEQVTRLVQARFSDLTGRIDAATVVFLADFVPPERRQIRALRALLTDRTRFMRFLRFLLEGAGEEPPGDGPGGPGTNRGQRRNGWRRVLDEDAPILEQLLLLLAREPSELRHLKAVIDEFSDEQDILPPDFQDLWDAIEPLVPVAEGEPA